MNFFEHIDDGFGLGEVGFGLETRFDEFDFEELFGDACDVGVGKVWLAEEFGDVFFKGALVAFGFAGLVTGAEAGESGFAGGDVETVGRRKHEFAFGFAQGNVFDEGQNVALEFGRLFVEGLARGWAMFIEVSGQVGLPVHAVRIGIRGEWWG